MRECTKEQNLKNCTCTLPSCERKGICCDCISYHRSRGELPGCYFPAALEATGTRSIKALYKVVTEQGTGYLR